MNMFNTDSGFRPPSPLNFAPPTHGLFGEPLGFDDFKLPGSQDFLNLPTSPPPMTSDPSMSLFNPSEQRYFSEFLDTLVVDQDFTFDPSAIPNLPNLPLFTPENMPSALNSINLNEHLASSSAATSSSLSIFPAGHGMMNAAAMDFDMTSPSSQSSFGGGSNGGQQHPFVAGGPSSFPSTGHGNGGDSPVSPASPSSSLGYTNPSKRKSTKAAEAARRSASISQDSSKISTPIQQLSKLSLNTNNTNTGGHHGNGLISISTTTGSNPKKNKRDEDEHPTSTSPTSPSLPSRSRREQNHKSRERSTPVSDGSMSDSANGGGTNGSQSNTAGGTSTGAATTKRKPYKELLTEEEKRANHIASEQKRRNTIRNGFKDMTDIIPELRDVNSSKSTILFKAVDFIKLLERQNRVLQEKASKLESRLMNQRNDGNGVSHGSGSGGMGGSGLDDQRLQDIPHIYPVPCNR